MKHVQRVTGQPKVHAFIGGFHLTGGLFEPIIPATVEALISINPDYVVPGHCTGFSAAREIAARLPQAFIQSSVGTSFVFEKTPTTGT